MAATRDPQCDAAQFHGLPAEWIARDGGVPAFEYYVLHHLRNQVRSEVSGNHNVIGLRREIELNGGRTLERE